jgi:hypothetical protein
MRKQRSHRSHRSLGEMISTATFLGLSAYLLAYSLGLLEAGDIWRGYGGLLAALLCGLGGLRFTIANFVAKWRGD